jgi:hypothetical protein
MSVPWALYGCTVARRPLVFVLALTAGDYLVWNWSLNGNHDVIALASGLSLPPLALASLWLLAVAAMRLLGAAAWRPTAVSTAQRRRSRGYRAEPATMQAEAQKQATAPATATESGSGKIAA